ncbi:zeta toxin family protein [Streptomyces mirabilis]|uniref:zeta toxin family protein n=1 Tax=Streptomyces mirabilis TaxID=68239 RepID=UPI0036446951
MTDPGVDRTYVLPQKQADLIFEQIVQTLLAGAVPQDQPIATVLSAPPGAGKTVLAQQIRATYPEGRQPVAIDVDAFRKFHPDYLRLRAEHGPQGADDLVQAQARIWFESAIDYLVEQRSHLIVEHGLRDRDVTDGLLAKLSAEVDGRAPYRIEAALLGTPAAVSECGILERYQLGHETTGQGRIVSAELHDERYAHQAVIADWLDADPRVRAVAIYQRGSAEPVYRNERLENGELRRPVATQPMLEEVRNRPFTLEQSRAYLTLHASLQARMAPEWEPRLQRALELAAPLLHPSAEAGPITDRPAVTFGRYQIVSIAHLDTVRTILRDFPSLEIGVLDLEARPERMPHVPEHLRDFYDGCEANTSTAKNPMSAAERAGFWQANDRRGGTPGSGHSTGDPPSGARPGRIQPDFPSGQNRPRLSHRQRRGIRPDSKRQLRGDPRPEGPDRGAALGVPHVRHQGGIPSGQRSMEERLRARRTGCVHRRRRAGTTPCADPRAGEGCLGRRSHAGGRRGRQGTQHHHPARPTGQGGASPGCERATAGSAQEGYRTGTPVRSHQVTPGGCPADGQPPRSAHLAPQPQGRQLRRRRRVPNLALSRVGLSGP